MTIRPPIRGVLRSPLRGPLESLFGGNPLSILAPASLTFADGDQPISIGISYPPADAVLFIDFENDVYFWDGAYHSLSDLTDNGDGTFDLDLSTGLDMGNLSGFVEVTNPETPVLDQTCFGLSNASNQRFEVATSDGTELRVYDSASAAYSASAFDNGGGSNSQWKRFRCAWNFEAGQKKLVVNGFSESDTNNTNAAANTGLDLVGIGYRRWFDANPFLGTVHKVCIINAVKTAIELRDLNRQGPEYYGVHWLGDSFLNAGNIRNDFDELVLPTGKYVFSSTDQVGGTSLTQQATSYGSTSEYYDQTLIIVDGGLTADDSSVAALTSISGDHNNDRWLYVQSNPTEATGVGNRPDWDDEDAAILAYCGAEHYLETLTTLQANGDGSSQDNTDIANDIIPSSLRADATHLNAAGQAIVGELVYNRVVAEGWLVNNNQNEIRLTDRENPGGEYTFTIDTTNSGTIDFDNTLYGLLTENSGGDGTGTIDLTGTLPELRSLLMSIAPALDNFATGGATTTINLTRDADGAQAAQRVINVTVT